MKRPKYKDIMNEKCPLYFCLISLNIYSFLALFFKMSFCFVWLSVVCSKFTYFVSSHNVLTTIYVFFFVVTCSLFSDFLLIASAGEPLEYLLTRIIIFSSLFVIIFVCKLSLDTENVYFVAYLLDFINYCGTVCILITEEINDFIFSFISIFRHFLGSW